MTTEEPTPVNIRAAWSTYQDILKYIATSPLDRVSLANVNQFVEMMTRLASTDRFVQSNSTYASVVLHFSLDTIGFQKKGGRFFKELTPQELSKLDAFVNKLSSVVTG